MTTVLRIRTWQALAIAYLVIRFAMTTELDALGAYASYVFEAVEIALAIVLAGASFFAYWKLPRTILAAATGSLLAGFAIFRGAGIAGIAIPFDLSGSETLLFLLVVAPILEELIFRFFLWQPLAALTRSAFATWLMTSLIFSYAHLHAIWHVPSAIHPFIAYQTVYTLGLGLACGFFVMRERSLAGAVAVHFAFNLGFYLGSAL